VKKLFWLFILLIGACSNKCKPPLDYWEKCECKPEICKPSIYRPQLSWSDYSDTSCRWAKLHSNENSIRITLRF